jgi:hypothetical protein
MKMLMRSVVAVLVTAGFLAVVNAARAQEASMPLAAGSQSAPAYVARVGRSSPGTRVESVLTDARGAVAGTKQGSGWLLHYGAERDNCTRADATNGLRMMCVAW